MLAWLEFRPGRIERLISEARKRNDPPAQRSSDGLTSIGDTVRELVAKASA